MARSVLVSLRRVLGWWVEQVGLQHAQRVRDEFFAGGVAGPLLGKDPKDVLVNEVGPS